MKNSNMFMNILITGASGFIGRNLTTLFHERDINVIALTRNKQQFNDKRLKVIESLEEISNDYPLDAIINLAGAPIDKRWSKGYKKILLDSRLQITEKLYLLIKRLEKKPKMLISASAIGYYGSQDDNIITENSPYKQEYTHELCKLWEQAALNIATLDCPVQIIRLGVVLGKNGGIIKKTIPPFKMGLGGKIGLGDQYMSWIHIYDVLRAILFLLEKNSITSKNTVYNLTSPFPITNAKWTDALSLILKRPTWFPMPKIMVRILFGEMGETLLLKGQRVVPENLIEEGFEFKYPYVKKALQDIIDL